MKKIIFCAFASDSKKQTGVNMLRVKGSKNIYFKNICVALLSAKKNNLDCDVALVTNSELPDEYVDFFKKNELIIINKEFNDFVFDDKCKWGLAFYKLCALDYVTNNYDYDNIAMIDCDTFTQSSFDNIWKECEENILLYDICEGLQIPDYHRFLKDISYYFDKTNYITHYGGEFIASKRERLKNFIKDLHEIYLSFNKNNILLECGDEVLISIAASFEKNKKIIKNAGAYIFRYWTGTFRLISTSYVKNPVTIVHLPDEKTRGLCRIYKKFKRNRNVSNKRMHSICHLKKPSIRVWLKIRLKKIKQFFAI